MHRFGASLRGKRRRVTFWHRVDDPQSYLVAQALLPIVSSHALDVELVLVPAPAADVDPEPILRVRHDLDDARLLAGHLGLDMPEPGTEPSATRVRLANAILLRPREGVEALRLAVEVTGALLGRDGARLSEIAEREGAMPGQDVRPRLEAAYRRLRSEGHYQGAVVTLDGEHFQGALRLVHLRARLGEPLPAEETAAAPWQGARVPVELFFSFRSPYSYVALERLLALREREPIDIVLRPVMPMVMRGLVVPRSKRLYIVRDAAREARRYGIAFGALCDPVGPGVERCLAAYVYAEALGKGLEFAIAASRAIWSEAADLTDDAVLASVAARVALDPQAVLASLGDETFRVVTDRNRDALYELGHWGVPVMRIDDFVVWGQDHVDLVIAEARRRAKGA
jgi:2-hydroxychromene-2-carboxylate isomerase